MPSPRSGSPRWFIPDRPAEQAGPPSPGQQRERQARQGEVVAQIQEILGADRFAEYKRGTDPACLAVSRLAERLDLPPTAAQQDDIGGRADATRRDQSLASADKSSQLAALADEATGKVAAVLGGHGLAAHRQAGGWWIRNLRPRTN